MADTSRSKGTENQTPEAPIRLKCALAVEINRQGIGGFGAAGGIRTRGLISCSIEPELIVPTVGKKTSRAPLALQL